MTVASDQEIIYESNEESNVEPSSEVPSNTFGLIITFFLATILFMMGLYSTALLKCVCTELAPEKI